MSIPIPTEDAPCPNFFGKDQTTHRAEWDYVIRQAIMISVVVCTYNRCRTLDRMLGSFFAQDGIDPSDHELIVVDNNSSDETRATAIKYADRPGFRYVHEAEQGLSAARNRGIREAVGRVIAFLDDDVLVGSGWLKALEACYQETSATVVAGKAELLLDGTQPEWLGPFFRSLMSEVAFGPMPYNLPRRLGLWEAYSA